MLLRNAQPSDSGTYQVAATMNPAWTMKAKINVHVAGKWDSCDGRETKCKDHAI